MDAKVIWKKDLSFVGVADSGYPVKMDSKSSIEGGAGPMEMVLIALAGCTAMDVISILNKKHQEVHTFEVLAHAERTTDFPKVFTETMIDYIVTGRDIDEQAVIRSMELSVAKYCPVLAMLSRAFPIDFRYHIYDGKNNELVREGTWKPPI
jgi:putative redox protein